jgi:hypothetical protein
MCGSLLSRAAAAQQGRLCTVLFAYNDKNLLSTSLAGPACTAQLRTPSRAHLQGPPDSGCHLQMCCKLLAFQM